MALAGPLGFLSAPPSQVSLGELLLPPAPYDVAVAAPTLKPPPKEVSNADSPLEEAPLSAMPRPRRSSVVGLFPNSEDEPIMGLVNPELPFEGKPRPRLAVAVLLSDLTLGS